MKRYVCQHRGRVVLSGTDADAVSDARQVNAVQNTHVQQHTACETVCSKCVLYSYKCCN
jgi:hypothetical protein